MQFLLRRETLQLYRNFLRVLRNVEGSEYRIELKRWVRSEFETAISKQDSNDEVCDVAIQMSSI